MIDADTDPPLIGRQIVDPIGRDLAQIWIDEVMHADRSGVAAGLPFAAFVGKISDEFFLFRVDGNDRLAGGLKHFHLVVDMVELGVAIRVLLAFPALAHGLQAVMQLVQQLAHAALTDPVPLAIQFGGQFRRALARPAQRRLRIASTGRLHQRLQIG